MCHSATPACQSPATDDGRNGKVDAGGDETKHGLH
jgi:hypothetical protein